jgi:hypothetical protein
LTAFQRSKCYVFFNSFGVRAGLILFEIGINLLASDNDFRYLNVFDLLGRHLQGVLSQYGEVR